MQRRELLRGAVAAPAIAATAVQEAEAAANVENMNVILFLTDQERPPMHFPSGWVRSNQPATTKLLNSGVSFSNAFCNSCMCSPSRASLMTSLYPARHGVFDTLSFGKTNSDAQGELPEGATNLATQFAAKGYSVAYKGKWHLSKPEMPPGEDDPHDYWAPSDLVKYGFNRWNPPDAGGDQTMPEFGGGDANNDGRFINSKGNGSNSKEGVLDYLRQAARKQQPFFLVVSLVNPHDVLAYPRTWRRGGYNSRRWLKGNIGLPETWKEDLSTKPSAHAAMVPAFAAGMGPVGSRKRSLNYLNFYGNLISLSDQYLGDIIKALDDTKLRNKTLLIKTSDHGEMGLAHHGLRQKSFNCYEETLRVPLVFSNPKLFPQARKTNAMVSHIDLLPTLSGLFNLPKDASWQGKDYSALITKKNAKPVQDTVGFTYDDIYMGQNNPMVPPPNRLVSLRESRYKIARYFDGDNNVPDAWQWEMYDLKRDPLEKVNMADPGYTWRWGEKAEFERLQAKLADFEATQL